MVAITQEDLGAVRVVLSGEASLLKVEQEYSTRHRVLLCAAIFAAVEPIEFGRHGEYGDLMEELTVAPGTPRHKSGRTVRYRLVQAAAHLGLHKADRNGDNLRIQTPAEIQSLLSENPQYRKRALELFWLAREAVRSKRQAMLERSEAVGAQRRHSSYQRRKLRQAMDRHPDLKWYNLPTDVDSLHRIHSALGKLLDRYFPEGE